MTHTISVATVGVALASVLLSACGTTPPAQTGAGEPATQPAASAEESTSQAPAQGSAPQVATAGETITVTGSGNGETPAITLDQPYYIVKTTNAAAADYGNLMVTVKGKELPSIMTLAETYTTIFQPDGTSVTFTIEAAGAYTIQFAKPPAAGTAVPAPQTFKGAAGTLVTPLVKISGSSIELKLKYLGAADENAPTGAMLASVNAYDAATGDSVLNVPIYVNKAKPEDSNGGNAKEGGAYFLIISGSPDGWEATISEG
jgi:hypothetical protein